MPGVTQPHNRRRRRPSGVSSSTNTHSPPTFLHLTLTFLLLCLLIPPISAAPTCLRFADYDSINQLFIDGGPGTKVLLCPSKVYRLSGTIVFTAADQELATFGYPTGSERAILRVESNILATAVQGDCRRCARVSIRSLVIDGNRSKLGRVVEGESTGLVVLGGNEGQSIRQCSIQDPRGFTAIHIREGDKLQCTSALIEENQIGPVGEEYDSNIDGPDPEMSPLGRPLADGISIACRNSQVKGNTFYDNTDAAIVLYCAPGTEVTGNTITTRTLSAMAGILAVDAAPFDGDYSGTVIEGNTITAESRTIRVGIGLGSAVWSDDTETVLKGGRVLGNSIKGDYMGFGIAAAGLKNWIVRDNVDTAIHQGRRSARCFEEPINPEPMAMVWDKKSVIDSEVQDDFQDHEFQYVVCIDGLEDKLHLQPIPDLPATVKEPEPEPTEVITFNTGSEVMDDILEHSQDRMLEAIEHLGRVMDIYVREGHHSSEGHPGGDMFGRLVAMEEKQKILMDAATSMRSAVRAWDKEMFELNFWQNEILIAVQDRLYQFQGHTSSNQDIPDHSTPPQQNEEDRPRSDPRRAEGKEMEPLKRRIGSNNARFLRKLGLTPSKKSDWDPVFRLILGQTAFLALYALGKRLLRRRGHRKAL